MTERIPPHDLAAEQSLLGAMLVSAEAVEVGLAAVRAGDFYRPAHRLMFEAVAFLSASGGGVDHVTVAQSLEASGNLEAAGGRDYLLEVSRVCPLSSNAATYADAVRRTAALRELVRAGDALSNLAADAGDHREVITKAQAKLDGIAERFADSRLPGVLLADVEAERVAWLWPGRIPFGKITIADGDPGLGKTTMALDLAARLTTGRAMPGETATVSRAGVVILSAEDDLADTIRPRLDAAGADCRGVVALKTVSEDGRPPALPDDIPSIRAAIERVGARLVIVDPLMAFLNGATDAHKDQSVRRALHRLSLLAEETGAAIVCIRHLNKAPGGNPLYRGGGSIGIIGAARSGLLVARDPDDPNRRVLAVTKSNLGPEADSLAFHLEPAGNGAARVVWDGVSAHGAGALLAAPTDPEERSALDDARDFLRDLLAEGPKSAKEIRHAADGAGIGWRTVERAKKALGVVSRQEPGERHGGWCWCLGDQTANPSTSRNVGGLTDPWRSDPATCGNQTANTWRSDPSEHQSANPECGGLTPPEAVEQIITDLDAEVIVDARPPR